MKTDQEKILNLAGKIYKVLYPGRYGAYCWRTHVTASHPVVQRFIRLAKHIDRAQRKKLPFFTTKNKLSKNNKLNK